MITSRAPGRGPSVQPMEAGAWQGVRKHPARAGAGHDAHVAEWRLSEAPVTDLVPNRELASADRRRKSRGACALRPPHGILTIR
jgi:hypothetical protein